MPPSASKRAIFASLSTLSATNAPVAPFGDREDHRDDRVARESTDERTIDLNQSNENCSRFRGTARFGIVEARASPLSLRPWSAPTASLGIESTDVFVTSIASLPPQART
jgi:hypothetical protein